MSYPISWVKVARYAELTGDSADAVHARRKAGKWLDGNECKIVDGNLWISLVAAQKWVEDWSAGPSRARAQDAGARTSAAASDSELWSLHDVARYLARHVETVRESMASLPSFPAAIQLPGRGNGRGKALYVANEVREWAASYQEKKR